MFTRQVDDFGNWPCYPGGQRHGKTRGIVGASRMDYRKKFMVEPRAKVHLSRIDASYTGKHETHEKALPEIQKHIERMDKLQYVLYADGSQSLLVVLQALDAAGKDGTIRHVFSGMDPQGTFVYGFKQP